VPIRNAVEIMRHQIALDPAVHRACDLLDRQVQHLVRLIDDLLDVSRISRGKLHLRRERIALSAVLDQALEVVRPLVQGAGQDLDLSLPADPVYLDADPVRLAQVFANLLDNAAKFTERGGRIRLSAACDGTEVAVSVEDSGAGIAPEHLPSVFELFAQLPAAPGRVRSGLGIGLALTRGLVEMHGGRIEAHSAGPGKGSTFMVRLPLVAAASVPLPDGPVTAPAPHAGGCRILVADDHPDVRESLAMLLELRGHEVATACDGVEAFEAAARLRPDLLLLDLGMPRLDGYGACRRIREQAWGRDLTVIALTGWGRDGDRRQTEEAGFDDHLVKPVAPAALLEIVAGTRRS
jgi:CheY-like chemotaxis protein